MKDASPPGLLLAAVFVVVAPSRSIAVPWIGGVWKDGWLKSE